MEFILQIIILIIVAIIFLNVRVGLSVFIAYTFLVPYCKLGFGGFVLQQNLINTIILFSVWLSTRRCDLKPFRAFLIFYGLILIAIPFANAVDFFFQIDNWRSGIMLNLFVPIAIWNIHYMKNPYSLLRNLLVSAIIIASVYGLFLTTMDGINPYIIFFYTIMGEDYRFDWFAADTRLFGRISSVFYHPMTFGMFLGCALIYIYSIRERLNKIVWGVLLFLIVANVVICGVRSVLFACLITFLYFLLACKKIKIFIGALLFVSIIGLVISLTPELYDYLEGVSDVSNQSSIGGSNSEMRLSQLEGCFREIRDCFIFGKGHMWHADYLNTHEAHPEILCFESLLYIIICDYGMFGFVIYGLMILVLLITQKKYIKKSMDRLVLTTYIVFYLSYCTFTGDYSYMKIWLIFYYLTFSEMYVSQQGKILLPQNYNEK